jgi:hypothetical protein
MDDFNWLLDDYNPGGSDFKVDYDLSSGYTGGNFGGVTYNPTYTPGSYDLGYDPSYQSSGVKYDSSNNWGGDFGKVSGTTTNTPYWEPAPSYSYQSTVEAPSLSYGFSDNQSFSNNQPFSFTATYGDGDYGYSNTGSGQNAGLYGGQAGDATLGSGIGANISPGAGSFGNASFTSVPNSGNSSITGGLGVSVGDRNGRFKLDTIYGPEPTLAERGVTALKEGAGYVKDKVGGALKAVDDYAAEKPNNTRLLLEGGSMLLGAYNQRAANKEAGRVAELQAKDREALRALQAEQMQMQRAAYDRNMRQLDLNNQQVERNNQQVERNNRTADQFNAQATQSVNEARSLYNPQEMAFRGMAQQRMGTQNLIRENERAMRNRGMSQAAIDAETRRARLGGTKGETTAYFQGLDTGRGAQRDALTSAKNLSQAYGNYGANYGTFSGAPGFTTSLGGTPDYTAAERMSKAGADMTKQYKDMLNLYLDDPIGRSDEAIRRRAQEKAAT